MRLCKETRNRRIGNLIPPDIATTVLFLTENYSVFNGESKNKAANNLIDFINFNKLINNNRPWTELCI